MQARHAGQACFGVVDVTDGLMLQQQRLVVRSDENARKGTFGVQGAGCSLQGQDGRHILFLCVY